MDAHCSILGADKGDEPVEARAESAAWCGSRGGSNSVNWRRLAAPLPFKQRESCASVWPGTARLYSNCSSGLRAPSLSASKAACAWRMSNS